MDVMAWRGYSLYDCSAEFRWYWLAAKLVEDDVAGAQVADNHQYRWASCQLIVFGLGFGGWGVWVCVGGGETPCQGVRGVWVVEARGINQKQIIATATRDSITAVRTEPCLYTSCLVG